MLNICKIGHVEICQETYVIHDVNICLHDKLRMCDMCRTYVRTCCGMYIRVLQCQH